MMLIKHTEDYRGKTIPPALIDAMGEFIGEYTKKGKFIDGAGLKSSHKGKRVQLRGGKLRVTDGPFTESKELVGGYAIIEAASDKEALDIATQFMELHRVHWPEFEGEGELRPFETGAPGSE
ncbi:MAG: YciI family protein [Gemmatimonadota bacterium]|nr:YciI family protein [Gemmatimonadota bacterium]